MRRMLAAVAALLSVLILTGCYESKVPLSVPGIPVDARLLGNWVQTSPADAKNPYRLLIRKYNPREYLVLFAEGDEAPSVARGYLSDMNGVKLMNLQNIDSAEARDRGYLFFKCAFEPDGGLRVRILSDDHPALHERKFTTTAQLRAVVLRHLKEENLFGTPLVFKPDPGVGLALTK